MKVAIHQANFIPWIPYFYKMAKADIFILLNNVQFEKNGYQNRFKYKDKWVTNPVVNKTEKILYKKYTSGKLLTSVNLGWINCIKNTLDIETPIVCDVDVRTDNNTVRLVELVKKVGGDTYLTNPNAKDKYLDEKLMEKSGIKIEYLKVPKDLEISMFEGFEKFGIEGLKKQLGR